MLVISLLLTAVSLAAIATSATIALHCWESRRLVRSRMAEYDRMDDWHTPPVALFAPVKGLDVGLEENLAALLELDYPQYEVTFVVESDADEAVPAIDKLIARSPVPCRRVVAGVSKHCGQKVHNLREATRDLAPEVEVLAFVDADARPHRNWLKWLVCRLTGGSLADDIPDRGASTGYRWMVPERNTLANLVLYSANSGVAGLLGRHNHNLVWGGSWAIRREAFDAGELRNHWRRTLSDDLVATQVIQANGRTVEFEPGCYCASPIDGGWGSTLEFIRRQFLISRKYAAFHWWWSLAGVTLMQAGLWLNVVAAAVFLARGEWFGWACLLAAAILYGLGSLRAWSRQTAAVIALPQIAEQIRVGSWFDILAGPLVGTLVWLTIISSAIGDCIVWRGVTYRIRNGGQIEILDRPAVAAAGENEAPAPTPDIRRAA